MSTATDSPAEAPAPVMNLYEGMFLVDSNKFASDQDAIIKNILGVLEKAGADVVAHLPWQDGKLAYQIDRYRKGLHYLTYFKMPSAGADILTRACKLNDTIIRHMIIRHDEELFDASVAALNPEAPPEEPPAEEGAPATDAPAADAPAAPSAE